LKTRIAAALWLPVAQPSGVMGIDSRRIPGDNLRYYSPIGLIIILGFGNCHFGFAATGHSRIF